MVPRDLDETSATTLAHYDSVAEAFWEGTRDHDVSQNIDALLRHIEGLPPFAILDLGCGPGRDLEAFGRLGHRPVGLDGSARFVAMARERVGCEVWHQDFLHLDLPPGRFDGVFANASLFHVPSAALPDVLARLHDTLKPRGVLFSSNPRGANQEGWQGARYGVYHDEAAWRRYMHGAGFTELTHYYRPTGLPREQQPWFASVWRRSVLRPSSGPGSPMKRSRWSPASWSKRAATPSSITGPDGAVSLPAQARHPRFEGRTKAVRAQSLGGR
jgi:SAM-dependent methyltransferase